MRSFICGSARFETTSRGKVAAGESPDWGTSLLEARVEDGLRVAIEARSANVSTLQACRLLNRENTK